MSGTYDTQAAMHVEGYCPMGCGRTLILGVGGEVTCSNQLCVRRSAVAEILADPETQHVVWFEEHAFTMLHPLRERLADEDAQAAIAACSLNTYIKGLDGPPVAPGKYRALARTGAGWAWEEVRP
jgi:hypothetical protein